MIYCHQRFSAHLDLPRYLWAVGERPGAGLAAWPRPTLGLGLGLGLWLRLATSQAAGTCFSCHLEALLWKGLFLDMKPSHLHHALLSHAKSGKGSGRVHAHVCMCV